MRSPLVAAVALLLSTSVSHAFDVSTCGLVVPAGEVGHLVGDLSCPGTVEAGVTLEKGASLSLDGHSLLGDGGGRFGVACVGRCTVTGPGEVGFFDSCLIAFTNGKLTVRDLDVHHCTRGINAYKVLAIDVDAHHHAEWAFIVGYDMKGRGVTADDNGLHGVYGRKVVLEDSAMRRNGSHAVSVDISFRGTNVTFEDNVGAGVIGDKIKASGLNATGNGAGGVLASPSSLALRDSTLVGNAGFDVGSERPPRLKDTTCDKSFKAPGAVGGPSWGVCAQD